MLTQGMLGDFWDCCWHLVGRNQARCPLWYSAEQPTQITRAPGPENRRNRRVLMIRTQTAGILLPGGMAVSGSLVRLFLQKITNICAFLDFWASIQSKIIPVTTTGPH